MNNIFKRLLDLHKQIEDIEDNLNGTEINYDNHFYSVIEFIEGRHVHIYCEDETGQQYNVIEYLEEIIDKIK